jgi:hypothetical protein
VQNITDRQTDTLLTKLMATDWVALGRQGAIFIVAACGAIAALVAALKPVPVPPPAPIVNVQPSVPNPPVTAPTPPQPEWNAANVQKWLDSQKENKSDK